MANMKRPNPDVITAGSAIAYLMEYAGTVPEVEEICVEKNHLGWIKSGATIEYTQSSATYKDDLGRKSKTIITEDGATVALGIITWNGGTLDKLASTARVTTVGNKRIVKIGGIGNDNGKSYVLCLHHVDKVDGDCWYVIVGKNTAGFSLAYKPDAETTVNPTFTAETMDAEGTLIKYIEEIVAAEG